MNLADLRHFVARKWDDDVVPRLVDYVRVPAKSPAFDASWSAHGYLDAVVRDAEAWCRAQRIDGMTIEVVAIDGRTPCLLFDVPATGGLGNDRTVLFYGHLDKQPEMIGWREDLGPWTPVIEDGKLYGRGSADDGYAIYAALTTIAAIDAQGSARPRCVGIIETCEESGSPDLPAYLELLTPRFGDVQLVVGLDSGCRNYEQLWVTTSLRGLVGGTLTVEILSEGVHSGHASGIVPSSFRIARQLLNRLDDPASGRVLLPELHTEIPPERIQQAHAAGAILGDAVWKEFPVGELQPRAEWTHSCAARHDRSGRGHSESDLAAGARSHRRRRPAIDRLGRQCAATEDDAQAQHAHTTDHRRRAGDASAAAGADAGSALQRESDLRCRLGRDRLERPGHRAVAEANA